MSFTVFLGNLPAWVTADDIKGWLTAETLVADAIKVIRNPETQESKGFAFIDAPNQEEMNAIIRRFDRAPLEDRLLRANPAQPPKPRGPIRSPGASGPPTGSGSSGGHAGSTGHSTSSQPRPTNHAPVAQSAPAEQVAEQRPPRRGKRSAAKRSSDPGLQSAFAEELAKAL
jgi:RNA recognition motif-containing protein